MFISTDKNAFAHPMQPSMASTGNGQSVMGRNRPALMPSARARTTAECAMRAVAPKDTSTISASSHMNVSARCSRAFTVS